jgi:uncharacterized repeat protein (TIGR03803 family)
MGTVFEITPFPTISTNINPHPPFALTTLHSFCSESNCTDGQTPTTGLVQSSDGNLYGTTFYGGAQGEGSVFEITPVVPLTTETNAGVSAAEKLRILTTRHSFCSEANCTDGQYPTGLVLASNGNLYGTTSMRGSYGGGTVFELTQEGKLTTLHSFCNGTNCTEGQDPIALVQGSNGNFYGTTLQGGVDGDGTVFSFPLSVPPVCNGVVAYYTFNEDIAVSNGDICQFFDGGVTGMAPDTPSLLK